ncbi:MAG: VCBS repeat-containing protein, partial [Acidobacteriota bacterium]
MLALLTTACGDGTADGPGAPPEAGPADAGAADAPSFTPAQAAAAIDFRHDHGGTGERYMPETMGSGAAWLDYDDDGHLDLYLVQGGPFPGAPRPSGAAAETEAPPEGSRLLRNRGDGTFEDVTELARATSDGYGMGACVGDVDNDGHADLYLSHLGPDQLLRNRGDGTFEDATAAARIRVDG